MSDEQTTEYQERLRLGVIEAAKVWARVSTDPHAYAEECDAAVFKLRRAVEDLRKNEDTGQQAPSEPTQGWQPMGMVTATRENAPTNINDMVLVCIPGVRIGEPTRLGVMPFYKAAYQFVAMPASREMYWHPLPAEAMKKLPGGPIACLAPEDFPDDGTPVSLVPGAKE